MVYGGCCEGFDIRLCCVQVLCVCVIMSFRYCSIMNMHLPIAGALFSNNYIMTILLILLDSIPVPSMVCVSVPFMV